MNWALVVMMCTRFCEPQYVELTPTKATCVAKLEATKGRFSTNNKCVPVVKE